MITVQRNIFHCYKTGGTFGSVKPVNTVGMTDIVTQDFNPVIKELITPNTVGMTDLKDLWLAIFNIPDPVERYISVVPKALRFGFSFNCNGINSVVTRSAVPTALLNLSIP